MCAKKIMDKVDSSENPDMLIKKKVIKDFDDKDEIEIVSIVPNVFFEDTRTGDTYEWVNAGDVETMTIDTMKHIMRNHKGYFRDMVLKPVDKDVIDYFKLTNIYNKYDNVLKSENYTRDKIDNICRDIKSSPQNIRHVIYDKIKNMVALGCISDIKIVRQLENTLGLELVEMIN